MSSPKGVKSGVPEWGSISCPTCGTRHNLQQIVLKLTNSVIYNVYIMNGWNHELPKGSEIRCSVTYWLCCVMYTMITIEHDSPMRDVFAIKYTFEETSPIYFVIAYQKISWHELECGIFLLGSLCFFNWDLPDWFVWWSEPADAPPHCRITYRRHTPLPYKVAAVLISIWVYMLKLNYQD